MAVPSQPFRVAATFFFLPALICFIDCPGSLHAQGLSGTPQRLDETLGQRRDPAEQASGQQRSGDPNAGRKEMSMEEAMMMEEEMMDEDIYSDDYVDERAMMGMGGGSSRSSGVPRSEAVQAYGGSLISLMEDLDLSPLFAPMPDDTLETSGPILGSEAEQAFKSGNQGLALELMFGHMTTEYRDAIGALQGVKYSTAVRRPVWAVRWGVSMAVRGGGAGDAQPIRQGATPLRNTGRNQGFAGADDFDDTGGFDENMGRAEEDIDMEMEMQMEEDMEMEMRGGSGGRRPPERSAPTFVQRSMLSESAGKTLDEKIGLVAEVVADEFAKRFQAGDFGPLFISVTAPAPEPTTPGRGQPAAVANPSMSAELNDALTQSETLPMWKPGIAYLGLVDSFNDVSPLASDHNLDLVLHFDVVLKPGRNDSMQNISRCRLINVAAQKSIGVSKGMDNREAAQMASAGRMDEREYVEQQLSNLFAIIDREVKVIELPNLTPEQARRRIASLISSPTARTLRTLAEIRLYQARDLLDEAEVEAAFDIVGGMDALTLLHGARQERLEIAREWAIESQGAEDQ